LDEIKRMVLIDDGVCRRIVLKNKKRMEFGRERVNLEREV
jgi:hypothetical protein